MVTVGPVGSLSGKTLAAPSLVGVANRSVPIFRQKRGRRRAPTEKTKDTQQAFGVAANDFRNLTQEQRAGWEAFLVGMKREGYVNRWLHSAINAYCEINLYRVLTGGPFIRDAPPVHPISSLSVDDVEVWTSDTTFTRVTGRYQRREEGVYYGYFEGGVPWRSPQRHCRDTEFWRMASTWLGAIVAMPNEAWQNVVERDRYQIQVGQLWEVRVLLLSPSWVPLRKAKWRGMVGQFP